VAKHAAVLRKTIAARSAREMELVIPTPFGFMLWDTLNKRGIHLILCLVLLRAFKTAICVGPVPPIL